MFGNIPIGFITVLGGGGRHNPLEKMAPLFEIPNYYCADIKFRLSTRAKAKPIAKTTKKISLKVIIGLQLVSLGRELSKYPNLVTPTCLGFMIHNSSLIIAEQTQDLLNYNSYKLSSLQVIKCYLNKEDYDEKYSSFGLLVYKQNISGQNILLHTYVCTVTQPKN